MSIFVKNGILQLPGITGKLRNKGCERPEFLNDYTMLDIETTGLSSTRDRITELGAVKVRDNKIVAQYSQLVFYPKYNKVPAFITRLNGITEAQLLSEGRPVAEAMAEFRDFIGSDVIAGYNVNFDLNFLYDLGQKLHLLELNNDYVDVLRLARVFYPGQHNRLLDCLQRTGLAQVEQHHGLDDSLDTIHLYDYFRAHFSPEQLAKAQGQLKNVDLLGAPLDEALLFRSPVKNKELVFVGDNLQLDLAEASLMVTNLGGATAETISECTNYVIVSDDDFFNWNDPIALQVKELKQAGVKISRLSEGYFLKMIDEWARI